MASPSFGRSTVTPSGDADRVIHSVPLTTATDLVTAGCRATDAANPGGSPPGVHASSVSAGAGRIAGVGVGNDEGGGSGPGIEGRGDPWAISPTRPPPASPAIDAATTAMDRHARRRLIAPPPVAASRRRAPATQGRRQGR